MRRIPRFLRDLTCEVGECRSPTGLDVIQSIMRKDFAGGRAHGAIALPNAAAPYLRAKATIAAVSLDFSTKRDGELDEYCKLAEPRERAANENSD